MPRFSPALDEDDPDDETCWSFSLLAFTNPRVWVCGGEVCWIRLDSIGYLSFAWQLGVLRLKKIVGDTPLPSDLAVPAVAGAHPSHLTLAFPQAQGGRGTRRKEEWKHI